MTFIRGWLGRFINKLFHTLPKTQAVVLANLLAAGRRKPVRFSISGEMLIATEGGIRRYSGETGRALVFWRNGIRERAIFLARQYFVDSLTPSEHDVVVDVGANMGDLGGFYEGSGIQYIALEPSPRVHAALSRSFPRHTILPYAAGSERGEIPFFLADNKGDSSVIEPHGGYSDIAIVSQVPLDELDAITSQREIFLLKIEAEGFEPEVLKGASETLRKTKYVALDGGRERGPDQLSTIEECTNLLMKAGFQLVQLNLNERPGVALFQRALND
jgi:FkbM family methyltransferase